MDEVKTHWDSMRIPPKMKYLMPIQHNPIHHHQLLSNTHSFFIISFNTTQYIIILGR